MLTSKRSLRDLRFSISFFYRDFTRKRRWRVARLRASLRLCVSALRPDRPKRRQLQKINKFPLFFASFLIRHNEFPVCAPPFGR